MRQKSLLLVFIVSTLFVMYKVIQTFAVYSYYWNDRILGSTYKLAMPLYFWIVVVVQILSLGALIYLNKKRKKEEFFNSIVERQKSILR